MRVSIVVHVTSLREPLWILQFCGYASLVAGLLDAVVWRHHRHGRVPTGQPALGSVR
jgi:hypothetical protein